MTAVIHWFTLLLSQWLMALPWLMVGVFFSSALFLFVPRPRWERILPDNPWWHLLYGVVLGMVLPVGNVGALPVTRRLLWQSGSAGMAIAFWLTAVSLHPVLLWQIWERFPENGEIWLFYLALSGVVTLGISSIFVWQRQTITQLLPQEETFSYPAIARPSSHTTAIAPLNTNTPLTSKLNILPVARKTRLSRGFYSLTRELIEWSLWLLLGCAVSSLGWLLLGDRPWTMANLWTVYGAALVNPSAFSTQLALTQQWLMRSGTGYALGFLICSTFLNAQVLLLMVNTFRLKAWGYLTILLTLTTLTIHSWLSFYIF